MDRSEPPLIIRLSLERGREHYARPESTAVWDKSAVCICRSTVYLSCKAWRPSRLCERQIRAHDRGTESSLWGNGHHRSESDIRNSLLLLLLGVCVCVCVCAGNCVCVIPLFVVVVVVVGNCCCFVYLDHTSGSSSRNPSSCFYIN